MSDESTWEHEFDLGHDEMQDAVEPSNIGHQEMRRMVDRFVYDFFLYSCWPEIIPTLKDDDGETQPEA